MDKPALDAPAEVDFYEAFRPLTALEKAALIWRMSKAPQVHEQGKTEQ